MHRVLHSLGDELLDTLSAASTLAEMQKAHRHYMSTALKRCFLTPQVRAGPQPAKPGVPSITLATPHPAWPVLFSHPSHGQTAIMSTALERLCKTAKDFSALWQHNMSGKADVLAAPSLGAGPEAVKRSVT